MTFRKLMANEIDCRVASVSKDGALMLLCYKDARVDFKILDEVFGIFGWQRKHEIIGGNLYCTVSVKNPETGEWISKQDVGVESFTEKEKGQASDSFKRACFNLGIGRELYTAPTIWVNKGDYRANDKGNTYDRFKVTEIGYDDEGNINRLTIENVNLKRVVFSTEKNTKSQKSESQIPGYPSRTIMMEIIKKKFPEGAKKTEELLKMNGLESLDDMTDSQVVTVYNKVGGC